MKNNTSEVIQLLNIHYKSFSDIKEIADKYCHPHPCDTRAWSQIIVSSLTQLKGIERKKGADLEDGSDVKAANTWGAIDTPRFNGCLKSGTKSIHSGKIASLEEMPYLFLVLWDCEPVQKKERCRIWVVRPQKDKLFLKICTSWYKKRDEGLIISNNFQLHPPRNKNSNVIRNTCGNLEYPLLFSALNEKSGFALEHYSPETLTTGECKEA